MKRFIFFLLLVFVQENLSARLPDLIPYRKGNLWGYSDSTKKIIIEPQYDFADFFSGSTAVVKKGDNFGIIDSTGKLTVPPLYSYIDGTSHHGKRIADIVTKKEGEAEGLIDENGSVIIPFMAVYIIWESERYLSVIVKSGHHGYANLAIYDSGGKMILPFEYLGWDFGAGQCGDNALFIVKPNRGKSFAVLDTNGCPLFGGKYQMIWFEHDVFECIVNKDSTVYYDTAGKDITETYFPFPYYKLPPVPGSNPFYMVCDSYRVKKEYITVYKGYRDIHGTEYWED